MLEKTIKISHGLLKLVPFNYSMLIRFSTRDFSETYEDGAITHYPFLHDLPLDRDALQRYH